MITFLTNKLFPFFRLIRWINLFVIILTMFLIRYTILMPVYSYAGYEPSMDNAAFFLLVLSVVMISAAGYIINDYFDIGTDRYNKPGRVILGLYFSQREAIIFSLVFNVLATLAGLYAGWKSGSFSVGLFFPMAVVLLWLYSVRYKRTILWGNIVVALLSAFVVMVVWMFEFLALRSQPEAFVALMGSMGLINKLILAYALFAFMVSMIREVIKDAEDVEGDARDGCRTFPVVYGVRATGMIALYLSVSTLVLLIFAVGWLFKAGLLAVAIYLIITVLLPLIFVLFRINSAKEKQDFGLLSKLLKLLMLAGIFSMLPLAYGL